jgi:hypothetical protein
MEMTEEQKADLATLNMQASEQTAQDIAADQQKAEHEQSQILSLQQELEGFIDFAVKMIKPIFPSLDGIYTPEVINGLSVSGASLCAKHGWMTGGLMKEWGEEIGFLVIALPVGYATYNGVKGDIAARQKQQAISSGATLEATTGKGAEVYKAAGSDTVTFGATIADK